MTIVNSINHPETSDPRHNRDIVIIQPRGRTGISQLRELWRYHELLYFLTWRDIKVRYKQAILGIAWAAIQPLTTMIVFSIFFGALADVPSEGLPYPLFAFAGLVPWAFFQYGVTQAANSVVNNSNLITKVYFPRLLVPLSSIGAGFVDFLVALGVFVVMMTIYGFAPTTNILFLPILTLLAFLASFGVGLWLSGINVFFRDVRHTTSFIVQVWLFLTPIAYPSGLLDEHWQLLYAVNPMVGVVEGFRWALLGVGEPPSQFVLVSTAISLVLVVTGIWFFRKVERTFADVV